MMMRLRLRLRLAARRRQNCGLAVAACEQARTMRPAHSRSAKAGTGPAEGVGLVRGPVQLNHHFFGFL